MKKLFSLAGAALARRARRLGGHAQDKVKACWMYVGPIGDFGYSYSTIRHARRPGEVRRQGGDRLSGEVPEGRTLSAR